MFCEKETEADSRMLPHGLMAPKTQQQCRDKFMDATLNGNFVQIEMLKKKKRIPYIRAVTLRGCKSDGLTRSLLIAATIIPRFS